MKFNERLHDQVACKFMANQAEDFSKLKFLLSCSKHVIFTALYTLLRDAASCRRRWLYDVIISYCRMLVIVAIRVGCSWLICHFSLFRVMIIVLKERQRFVITTWINSTRHRGIFFSFHVNSFLIYDNGSWLHKNALSAEYDLVTSYDQTVQMTRILHVTHCWVRNCSELSRYLKTAE